MSPTRCFNSAWVMLSLAIGSKAHQVDVVLAGAGVRADDGAEPERALRVDAPARLPCSASQVPTSSYRSTASSLQVRGDVERLYGAVEQHRQHVLHGVHVS